MQREKTSKKSRAIFDDRPETGRSYLLKTDILSFMRQARTLVINKLSFRYNRQPSTHTGSVIR